MYVSTHTHGKLPLCRYKAILPQQIIDIVDTSEEGLAFFFFFFQATLAGDTVVEQNNPPTCHLIELNKLKKILKLCISNLRLSGHFGFDLPPDTATCRGEFSFSQPSVRRNKA